MPFLPLSIIRKFHTKFQATRQKLKFLVKNDRNTPFEFLAQFVYRKKSELYVEIKIREYLFRKRWPFIFRAVARPQKVIGIKTEGGV